MTKTEVFEDGASFAAAVRGARCMALVLVAIVLLSTVMGVWR